jgi:hypothetical protein
MVLTEYDRNYNYYICYINKDNQFIYKLTDVNYNGFLLEDFIPDNALDLKINKNIPSFFHKYLLQIMYNYNIFFRTQSEDHHE